MIEASSSGRRELIDLVARHRAQVAALARPYGRPGIPLEDLEAEGTIGLIEAAARFDAAHGAEFATYASWWIHKRIRECAARHHCVVRFPRYQIERIRRSRIAERELAAERGRRPTGEEIARRSGLTVAEVEFLRARYPRQVSLDDPVDPRHDLRIADILADRDQPSPDYAVVLRETLERVRRMLRRLPSRYREVLSKRFGLDGAEPMTLAELGASLSLSRERVHQIERQALRVLRRELVRVAPGPPGC